MGQLGTFGWKALGATSLALGAVGIALPLIPTTPFLLLALFAFSKGSPQAADWLKSHAVFGPVIDKWNKRGAIAPSAKILAISMMAASLAGSWHFGFPTLVLTIQAVILSACAAFILSRQNE